MQFLLDIDDALAPSLMEVIRNLRSAKAVRLTSQDADILQGLKIAVKEVKLAKQGKLKLQSARELLAEL